MRAVSDTSPISNLASIGKLPLLKVQFSEIWIPPAVLTELNAHPNAAALRTIHEAVHDGWIKRQHAASTPLLAVLSAQLHLGEAEAIALASDLKADVVLIDEQEARQRAAEAGLSVIGVLGVLLRAKRTGLIPLLKPEITALKVISSSPRRWRLRCLRPPANDIPIPKQSDSTPIAIIDRSVV